APFAFARVPDIVFGAGKLVGLPQLILRYGRRILLVTGSASFVRSEFHARLKEALEGAGIDVLRASLSGEPSPEFVDATTGEFRGSRIDCVVGIGGGSAIDAGKAISAMLPQEGSVAPFLEQFNEKKHDGRKLPYIAVPTSSGTGSEASKNAVLSHVGRDGYKSSLRQDNLVPDMALIDPQLMLSCPPDITAACGLDALTQLIEAYVSSKASPLTDALMQSGLEHAAAGFLPAVENGRQDLAAREHMAYAALLSGIGLANAGLGVVHGFAGPLGGFFPIPHGVVCGTLLGAATRINIAALRRDAARNRVALEKYARAGVLLSGKPAADEEAGCELLVETLDRWIAAAGIARLSAYGVTPDDFPRILERSNNKNSPITLVREEMRAILEARL
ncbi:MAG: iron-containing alcohol dehydrogenase, partial [Candidatus Accumulibacter sp.]|nr:iron-containing alcohol dehydrogenase [Accumulibacter sp.]